MTLRKLKKLSDSKRKHGAHAQTVDQGVQTSDAFIDEENEIGLREISMDLPSGLHQISQTSVASH